MGLSDLAWTDPDWARDQILWAKAPAQLAKKVAQDHVVSHFQYDPSQLDESTPTSIG